MSHERVSTPATRKVEEVSTIIIRVAVTVLLVALAIAAGINGWQRLT